MVSNLCISFEKSHQKTCGYCKTQYYHMYACHSHFKSPATTISSILDAAMCYFDTHSCHGSSKVQRYPVQKTMILTSPNAKVLILPPSHCQSILPPVSLAATASGIIFSLALATTWVVKPTNTR